MILMLWPASLRSTPKIPKTNPEGFVFGLNLRFEQGSRDAPFDFRRR
jgi:hypothetical protein